jgi:mono/diheme cytochrome c family protein
MKKTRMSRALSAALALSAVSSLAMAQGAPDRKAAEKGYQLYETNCLTCHGPDMINPGTVSYDLRKFPADQKPRFVNSVTNGKGQGMPAWRGIISADEVEQLWAYVMTRGKL